MILLKNTIISEYENGNLSIHPFVKENVGPNSIDVTLAPVLRVYKAPRWHRRFDIGYLFRTFCAFWGYERGGHVELDVRDSNPVSEIVIPEGGFVLKPGIVYLGSTVEAASSDHYVPMYEGRSSMGRLGISSACCAGFGDVGFAYDENRKPTLAKWTLEITVTQRVRVYPGIRIGQVFFNTPDHDPEPNELYRGKYSFQQGPTASQSWADKATQS
jgi:dCTP deaminase